MKRLIVTCLIRVLMMCSVSNRMFVIIVRPLAMSALADRLSYRCVMFRSLRSRNATIWMRKNVQLRLSLLLSVTKNLVILLRIRGPVLVFG